MYDDAVRSQWMDAVVSQKNVLLQFPCMAPQFRSFMNVAVPSSPTMSLLSLYSAEKRVSGASIRTRRTGRKEGAGKKSFFSRCRSCR